MSRILKFSAISAAVAVVLYAGGTYFGVPIATKSILNSVAQKANCEVSIDTVSFNPFSLTFSLEGLKLSGQTLNGSHVSLKKLVADASISSLFHLAPIVEKFEIDGLDVNFVLNKKNLEILNSLSNSDSSNTQTPNKEQSSDIPQFSLANFAFTNSSITIHDEIHKLDQKIEDISIILPFISTIPTSYTSEVTPHLSLKVNGTSIAAKGEVSQANGTQSARLNLAIDKFDLSKLAKSCPMFDSMGLNIASALVSTNLNVSFTSGKTQSINASGLISLNSLDVSEGRDNRLKLSEISVNLKEVNPIANKIHLSGILLKDFNANLAVNTQETSSPTPNNSKQSASTNNPSWSILVDKIDLVNAAATIKEVGLNPATSIAITNTNFHLTNLNSNKGASPAKFNANTSLLGGKITASGSVGLTPFVVDSSITLTNLSTNSISPLLEKLSGFNVNTKITGNLKAKVSEGNIIASGKTNLSSLVVKSSASTLLTTQLASVDLSELDLANKKASISSIFVNGLEGYLTKTKDGFVGLKTSSSTDSKEQEEPQDSNSNSSWKWDLGRFELKKATLSYKDPTTKPAGATNINDINVTALNLGSDVNKKAKLDLSARAGSGSIFMAGEVNPTPLAAAVNINFKNFDLKPFNSLLIGLAGIGTKSGLINTDLNLNLRKVKDKTAIGIKGSNLSLKDIELVDNKQNLLFAWSQVDMVNFDFSSADPFKIHIDNAEISVPDTKETKGAKDAVNIASSIAGLFGHKNTEKRLDKVNKVLNSKISLHDINFDNGKFTAQSSNKLAEGILATLSKVVAEKINQSNPQSENK